jgi:hypothetical protein
MPFTSIRITDGENFYNVEFSKKGAQVFKEGKEVTDVDWITIASSIVSDFVYDEP